MIEFVYRIDQSVQIHPAPKDAPEAKQRIEAGNRNFSDLVSHVRSGSPRQHVISVSADDLGMDEERPGIATQAPFAAVLACSDARVPTEMVLEQGFNDLFVVRVAGNVLGQECLGSIRYALDHFRSSLRLVVVLGHAHCGAVTAAVDTFLEPRRYLDVAANQPLRLILDRIMVAARTAAMGLEQVHGPAVVAKPGYRRALIEAAVVVNAAWNAFSLTQELKDSGDIVVEFGVYDLATHSLGALPSAITGVVRQGLFEPPRNAEEFRVLVRELCGSESAKRLVEGLP
jgi:carbonic anhydrase